MFVLTTSERESSVLRLLVCVLFLCPHFVGQLARENLLGKLVSDTAMSSAQETELLVPSLL